MAPHSSTLAWKTPWMEEPGRLQSMGSLRVGYDWTTSLSLFTFMHWRRKWQPTPVFLPGESQGWEPGGLLSMGSHRVGHDWSDLAHTHISLFMPASEGPSHCSLPFLGRSWQFPCYQLIPELSRCCCSITAPDSACFPANLREISVLILSTNSTPAPLGVTKRE